MERTNEYKQIYRNYVPPPNEEVHPISERFMQDATNCINMNMRPPESTVSGVKPVNFSIQTGEEFALEFMRDRVLPRKPAVANPAGDPNYATGYMDLKGLLGISHTESESGSDMSMLTLAEKGAKDYEKKNSSLYEGKSNYPSMQSVRQNSSAYGSSRGFPGYASGASDSSSAKIKVLCSFGGRILPRPSDGKLRYVGGETRIIRISRDISWQELKQKTSAMLEQTHTIKYQLPGEDLDALVSVCSDEDLQNMMEECTVQGNSEGSKKLRLFLFTLGDLEEANYNLNGGDIDSEFQYVVAVNCMDIGVRKRPGMHDLASSSANDLEALMGQTGGRETSGINGSAYAGVAVSSSGIQALEPVLPVSYPTQLHHFQGQMMQHEESKGYPLHATQDIRSAAHLPHEESSIPMPPQGLSNQENLIEPQFHQGDMKGKIPAEEQSGPIVSGVSAKEFSELPPKGEKRRHEHVLGSAPYDTVHAPILETRNHESSYPREHGYPSEHVHSEPNSVDLKPDELPATQRPYLSVNIPREQGELLNRLTKSDDSLNPQFLLSHSRPRVGQQDSVIESSEELQNVDVPAQAALHTVPKTNLNAERESMSRQGISSAVDQRDPRDDKKFVECNLETTGTYHDLKRHVVGDANEVGHGCTDVRQSNHGKEQDPASSLPDFKWADETDQNITSGPDILIDINDRFPRDLLSAILSEESSCVNPLPHDGAGLSMNIENHEPKRWSFFKDLAKDDYRKDVSLIDQDHPMYSSGLSKVDAEVHGAYQFTGNGIPPSHGDPHSFGVYSERELPGAVATDQGGSLPDYGPSLQPKSSNVIQFEGIGAPYSDYEETKQETKHVGLPPLDPNLVDIDMSGLQIIKNEDLEELRELGSGTFGTVYHGKWRGTDVAIKRIKKSCFTGRSSEQERLTVEFWREAEILSKLHHPNVVAFYGVVQDGPGGTLATVTEFMVDGSLRHVLLRKDRHLDRRKRLIIAMDAAFGMEYLHSKDIVHFDLKCDNLLVNLKDPSRPICKVGDFGLSKIKRNTLVSGGVRGTLPWMAPELLNGSSSKVSEKVDVFSFGIVLWEILTGEEPYANMHYGAIIGGIVNNTLRPPIPSFCDLEWRRLMEQCWAPNPAARPSFTEIAGRLRSMAAACQPKAQGQKASH